MPSLDTLSNARVADNLAVKLTRNVDEIVPSFLEIANGTCEYIFWVEDRNEGEAFFQFANDAFLSAFGYTSPEIYGHSLKELMNPYHYNVLRERYYNGHPQQGHSHYPMITGLKNCEGKWTEMDLYASFVHSRKHFSAILFCRDVESRLRHANRYYELYDNAIDGTFTIDREGRAKNGNKRIEQLTGYRTGRLNEDLFEKFMPKENATGVISFLKLRLEGKLADTSYQFEFLSKDGTKKYFEVTAIPNPASDYEIIVNIRDVTNIKRLEEEIRESEEKYRSLVEQSRDLIFVIQGERAIFANSITYQRLGDGLKNPNLTWRGYIKQILPEDQPRITEFLEENLKDLEKNRLKNNSTQFSVKRKEGEILQMTLTTDIINYQGQKALYGVIHDVTKSKKLEQKIKESEKLGTLAQFAASVAHEIRNPLEGLTSAVTLLSRGLKVQGEDKELLDVIQRGTAEINRTVNQFVSMTDKPRYHFSKVDPRTLLSETIDIVKNCKAYDPRVAITSSYQRKLPSIHGDEAQLQKALSLIISNACQAISGEGSVKTRVEKTTLKSKAAIKITIRDSGGGIPADVFPHVWEPFVTTRKKGLGLGLFITKRCIEDHGGIINIPKTDRMGTTVQIVLPAHQIEE